MSVAQDETTRWPNPLPPANSRRPFRFRRLGEVRCSLVSSERGFPAAVAEGGRWALRHRASRHRAKRPGITAVNHALQNPETKEIGITSAQYHQ